MQVEEKPMTSLRLKVTDRCPWNCWWCHNEGTGVRNIALTKDIPWVDETQEMMQRLREELGLSEIHLTGGEPTSHPHILQLASGLSEMGFGLKMTTIGCAEEKTRELVRRGVSGFNFSIHSLDPSLLADTQIDRSESTMDVLLKRQVDAVRAAVSSGAIAKANLKGRALYTPGRSQKGSSSGFLTSSAMLTSRRTRFWHFSTKSARPRSASSAPRAFPGTQRNTRPLMERRSCSNG